MDEGSKKQTEVVDTIAKRDARTKELLQRLQAGDACAKEVLVAENLGLVWSIVHRFSNRGYEKEDLFQVGSIGLLKAMERFDLTYEVKFSTYAVPMIQGELQRFIRDDGVIKISRTIKENYWKIQQEMLRLQKQGSTEITLDQLAKATGLSAEEIMLAQDAPIEVESLHQTFPAAEGNTYTLEERIAASADEKDLADNRIWIEQSLRYLDARERQLIYLRYFQDFTQAKTAAVLQMSQVQVSRLEKKILKRLREQM